jgi:hypothetical protein
VHERGVDLRQVGVVVPPREVRELVVGRTADDDGVTVGEVLRLLVELDDLGGADEREVLRVGVEDQPLAGVGVVRDRRELFALFDADARPGLEGGELLSDGKHRRLLLGGSLVF